MEQGKFLTDALQTLRLKAGEKYDVNSEPTANDVEAIEVLVPGGALRFSIGKEYTLVDAGTTRSPTIVLLSTSSKRLITIDCSNPNVFGISYVFREPVLRDRRPASKGGTSRNSI